MMETIGTRPEEDNSYNTAITLIVTFTIGIVLCSLLEMVGYFLYNMKVWRQIEKNNILHDFFFSFILQNLLYRSQRLYWTLKKVILMIHFQG